LILCKSCRLYADDDGKYEEEFVVGLGGAQILFLPCKVDGFWSNVRQVIPSLYLARKFNLTYVDQEMYYRYQDKGHIGGIDGPVSVFEIFDREYMGKFIGTQDQESFWASQDPTTSPLRDNITYAGIEYGMR